MTTDKFQDPNLQICHFNQKEGSEKDKMASAVFVKKFGGHESLQIKEQKVPSVTPGGIVVDVRASGMNFADIYMRQGFLRRFNPPFVLGLECAGIVEEVGSNVAHLKKGDRVLCYSPNGGMMSQTVSVPANQCYLMPKSMSFEDGASMLINYATAYGALFGLGGLKPKQVVFVHSIAGGVGCAIVQLAKTVGEVQVIGTASPAKHEAALEIGANCVFSYEDYKHELAKKYPEGVDIFIDNKSGSEFMAAMKLLRPMGKLIHLGAASAITGEKRNLFSIIRTWWELKPISILDMIKSNISVCGMDLTEFYKQDPERFDGYVRSILELYEKGQIKPTIDSVWDFDKVQQATAKMANRENVGKIVLRPPRIVCEKILDLQADALNLFGEEGKSEIRAVGNPSTPKIRDAADNNKQPETTNQQQNPAS